MANVVRGFRLSLCLFVVPCIVAQLSAQTRRIVYVLAGQSNIAKLEDPTSPDWPSTPSGLVTYWTAANLYQPVTGIPDSALLNLGEQLGQAHAPDRVDIVMIAKSGSALLKRNQFMLPTGGSLGYWIDPGNLGDPNAFLAGTAVIGSLIRASLPPINELHIVWGQGETDCGWYVAQPASQDEYSYWAQILFGLMAVNLANTTSYDVHLVTPGAILDQQQSPQLVNGIRDAYFDMERNPMTLSGWSPRIASVAHHYDLPHADLYHLTLSGYGILAQRIVTGIRNPTALPKVTGGLAVSGTDATATTIPSVPLTPVALGTSFNNYFAVTHNNGQPVNFQVMVLANSVIVRASTTLLSPVHVRYVAGSGFNGNWTSGPIVSTTGSPLEPFSF